MAVGSELVAAAAAVLLDFDGPCCRLFAGADRRAVMDRLDDALAALGRSLPATVRRSGDPMAALRWASGDETIASVVEPALRAIEVDRAAGVAPRADLDDFVRWCHDRRIALAVVTNNAPQAVDRFVAASAPALRGVPVRGRSLAGLAHLKPAPALVEEALATLGVRAKDAVLVGDSPSDMAAARAAGCRAVGLQVRPGRAGALRAAGADAVVESLAALHPADAAGPARHAHPAPLH